MVWTWLILGFALGLLLAVPVGAIWNRRTIRRVRDLEARARSAERLAELGTLTSGLAHEIKNPLSTIGLNLQLLQEDLSEIAVETDHEKLGRMQRRFDTLRREADRLRETLEDFLRFAGRIELDLTPDDVHVMIHELIDFYEPQANAAGVQLRTQLAADPAVAPVDAGLLKQALLNLLINATQAMAASRAADPDSPASGTTRAGTGPHGGCGDLIVRTRNVRHLDRDEIEIHIIDTGPGIPADVLPRVFQPYFSTKRGGTGLGLPTSRRIIEEHGGRLTVHSEPGRGTDFTIALPAAGEPDGA